MAVVSVVKPGLFPDMDHNENGAHKSGVLPSQEIRALVESRRIHSIRRITEEQIQPASLDLRLGDTAYRVQASFLPGVGHTVRQRIHELQMSRLDLTSTTVLERECVYIVPLSEELDLPDNTSAIANPKSSTGRLDVFTRLIVDNGKEFEYIPAGYRGPLFAEIVPRAFPIILRSGMRLNQLRFVRGTPPSSDTGLVALDQQKPLVYMDDDAAPTRATIDNGLRISINLQPSETSSVIAFRAKKNPPVVDLEKLNHYAPEEFWDAVTADGSSRLIFDPGAFYILASKEKIRVPPEYAAEMVPFDPSMGEFRVHYAGFFDPGFGYGAGDIKGTRAVLEVRAHEVPFMLEDGQTVGRLTYTRLLSSPDKVYGTNIGSSYQRQGLALSKHFRK